jgi:import inner membrane translocase subunit TIM21
MLRRTISRIVIPSRNLFHKSVKSQQKIQFNVTHHMNASRSMSTSTDKEKVGQLSTKLLDEDEYEDYNDAKTPGQKLRWIGIVLTRLGFLVLGSYCFYLTAVELFPGRMSPNHLYNTTFEIVRYNAEIIEMTGEGMKAFGRDVGGSTEGRRNHVDQYKYIGEDGSKRTRVRFNVQGSKGKVRVWAEVSEGMQSGDLVYLICQNVRTGRVYTLVDNRASLDSKPPAAPKDASNFFGLFQNK